MDRKIRAGSISRLHTWIYKGRFDGKRVFVCDRPGCDAVKHLDLYGPGASTDSLFIEQCPAIDLEQYE